MWTEHLSIRQRKARPVLKTYGSMLPLTKDQWHWRSSSNWFSFFLLVVYTHSPLEPWNFSSEVASWLEPPFYWWHSDCSLPMVLLSSTEPAGLQEVQKFLGQIRFYQYLGKHKNLVQLEGCCTEGLPLYMVLEDVAQGDLLSFLWTCRRVSGRVEVLGRKGLTWLISCSHVN